MTSIFTLGVSGVCLCLFCLSIQNVFKKNFKALDQERVASFKSTFNYPMLILKTIKVDSFKQQVESFHLQHGMERRELCPE